MTAYLPSRRSEFKIWNAITNSHILWLAQNGYCGIPVYRRQPLWLPGVYSGEGDAHPFTIERHNPTMGLLFPAVPLHIVPYGYFATWPQAPGAMQKSKHKHLLLGQTFLLRQNSYSKIVSKTKDFSQSCTYPTIAQSFTAIYNYHCSPAIESKTSRLNIYNFNNKKYRII